MSERYKIVDIDSEQFYQLPKALFSSKCYRGLSSNAKIIYAFLKDRMWLSRKYRWLDENGDIYLIYTQTDLSVLLDISASTVSRELTKLTEYGLIDSVRQGCNRPNKIYIRHVETAIDADDCEHDPYVEGVAAIPSDDMNEVSNADDYRTCTHAYPDLHQRNTGLAPMQVRTCTHENPDLHPCISGLAPVHASNTNINNTNKNKTEKNKTDNNNSLLQGIEPMPESALESPLAKTVVVELSKLGITVPISRKLLAEYGATCIQSKLAILKRQPSVQNPAGFLLRALQEDYADYQEALDIQQQQRQEEQRQLRLRAEAALAAEQAKVVSLGIPADSAFRKFLHKKSPGNEVHD